jgi:hypothetical protein
MTVKKLALLIVAASLGCASASSTKSSAAPTSAKIITLPEIVAAGLGETAYDLIRRLRPNWLTTRGQTSVNNAQAASAYPNVYVDGVAYGDINTLRNLNAGQIGEIRFHQAYEAQTTFGMGNPAGVIAITTRR